MALDNVGFQNVGYSEIDNNAIKNYNENFPNKTNYGDITKMNEKELPNFDLLIGGSPCQGFSIAGKKLNFKDERRKIQF